MNQVQNLNLTGRAITAGILLTVLTQAPAFGQGCVAVRGAGACSINPGAATNLLDSKWLVSTSYRFLHSDRHFRGGHEEVQRKEQGTEVINRSHFLDLSVSYAFTPRYSITGVIPFVAHDRTSLYEHRGSGARYHSGSHGIGDVRLSVAAWILDPAKLPSGNLQVGLGFKAPTGEYAATDTFRGSNGVPVIGYVDQSIQPGDGGWGITLDLNAYQVIGKGFYAYGQGFYLANPRDMNGTSTSTGAFNRNPLEGIMSVPDQYLVRGGIGYNLPWVHGLAVTLGGRIEGVPTHDLIGGENGFRRPGYAISIEPGVSWMFRKWNFAVTTPVLMDANRQRSTTDKVRGTHGDAAFASFLVSVSVSRAF